MDWWVSHAAIYRALSLQGSDGVLAEDPFAAHRPGASRPQRLLPRPGRARGLSDIASRTVELPAQLRRSLTWD